MSMNVNKKFVVVGLIFGILCLIGFYLYRLYYPPKVVYYAKLEKVSTSGEARFRRYDINLQKVIDQSILLVLCNTCRCP